jgi:site-specific DNA-methyltransferase (adenine-specific)
MFFSNTLMRGDNLELLKGISDASVDLIYMDPPFNSKRNYMRVDSDKNGEIELKYFRDIWKDGSDEYLEFLFKRLVHMRRTLKETGSIYLHCDSTESHYIKVMMDKIFGRKNFRNEIVWCYSGPANVKKYFPRKHDVILFYAASDKYTHNEVRVPYEGKLTVGGKNSWAGTKKDPSAYTKRGKLLEDWWKDIPALQRNEKERCGYPTQKPLGLLKRIIQASSKEGDLVLDPFMGSGTALVAAHELSRRFVGMDMNLAAIKTGRQRLSQVGASFEIVHTDMTPPDISLKADGSKVAAVINSCDGEVVNFSWWIDSDKEPIIAMDKNGMQDFNELISQPGWHTIRCRVTDERGSETIRSIQIRIEPSHHNP